MEVYVFLKIGDGSFERGFSKTQLEVKIDPNSTHTHLTQLETQLPPVQEIPNSYEAWKRIYEELINLSTNRGFKNHKTTTYFSIETCLEHLESLKLQLNQWLSPIKSLLKSVITPSTNYDISLVVNTHNVTSESVKNILHRLPWHECNLVGENSSLEVALCFNDSSPPTRKLNSDNFKRIKIISILGDSTNIDTSKDEKLIIDLEKWGADIDFLKQPKREELDKLLNVNYCDVLFYSGHSYSSESGKKGIISLNDNESLDLEEISGTLQSLIDKAGLQLAFFNSSDGLGLARFLVNLNLPYVIVWREPVPDVIVQRFFESFLFSYYSGDSLFTAVWKARVRLQELASSNQEKLFTRISGSPIICTSYSRLQSLPYWSNSGGLSRKIT